MVVRLGDFRESRDAFFQLRRALVVGKQCFCFQQEVYRPLAHGIEPFDDLRFEGVDVRDVDVAHFAERDQTAPGRAQAG